ncbi:MAG: multidrug efflux RND transporter permease subunit [Pseudomonadales bacterium]|nr:multidrug efflux RND transporter permease subunit [Pseudomonadales bacterium]MBO6596857.1 multidrug efflux RND transporter permease subunit [Pseudomonadales bacterium]MBO6823154.1 multidrug efflux RND transporter permease subunit [Pseudomonadales bacterium]
MISRFCIDRPIFASIISIVIVLVGAISVISLPIDQYPDITPPAVSISASFPGATAASVEQSVAAPIEKQLNGVPNMIYIESNSKNNGGANVTVTFEVGTNVDLAAVDVQNEVKLVEQDLPVDVMQEGVSVEKLANVELMKIAIRSDDPKFDEIYLSNYMSINIRDEMKRIPGVGRTRNNGSRRYSMRIWLKPDLMAAYGLTTTDVMDAVKEQNIATAAGTIGGQPNSSEVNLTYPVSAQGRLETAEEFGAIIVKADPDGSMVRLRDVARVELGAKAYTLDSRLDGGPAAVLGIYLLPGANALEVSAAVREKMAELEQRFPDGLEWLVIYDSAEFIEQSISEVIVTLIEALILVMLVVYLFLQNWRTTLIPSLAVPVSVIGTFIAMLVFGFTLNTVNLLALVLVIGIVVDDAIVVVENVERLMNEEDMSARDATIRAMNELTGALVATSLVLAAVFVPVALLPGITGILYREFAITITVAVLISTVVALTLSPALCAILMKKSDDASKNVVFRKIDEWLETGSEQFGGIVGLTLQYSKRTILLFILMGGAAYLLMNTVPSSFMPVEDKGMFYVDMEMHQGSSVNRTKPVLERAERYVMNHPAVKHVFTLAGENRRSGGNEANGQMEIILNSWEEREPDGYTVEKVIEEVRRELETYPEIVVQVSQPPAIAGLGLGSGVDLVLQDRTGTNWEGLLEATDLIIQKANQHPVLTGVASPVKPETPELFLKVNRAEAKALGVPLKDIYGTMRTYTGSSVINDFNLYGRVYRVMVQAEDEFRMRPDALQYYYVKSSSGNMVPLSVVSSIDYSTGPAAINHYNMFTAAKVSGDPNAGYSTGDAINAMREVLDTSLPPGIGYEWTGLTAQEVSAGGEAAIAMILAVVFVYLFLCALYESWTVPISVLLIAPAAIFGALIAVSMRGLENNIFFQVAMVALVGMAAKNSILIVEFAKQLVEDGKEFTEAALESAKQRFRPIMMTAISFIFGVMPLVLSSGPGAVARQSISTAVLGGMILATTIGIVLVPLFFVLFGSMDRRLKRHAGNQESQPEMKP